MRKVSLDDIIYCILYKVWKKIQKKDLTIDEMKLKEKMDFFQVGGQKRSLEQFKSEIPFKKISTLLLFRLAD